MGEVTIEARRHVLVEVANAIEERVQKNRRANRNDVADDLVEIAQDVDDAALDSEQ